MNIIRAGQKGLYVSGYVWACIVLGLLGFVYRVLRKIKLKSKGLIGLFEVWVMVD